MSYIVIPSDSLNCSNLGMTIDAIVIPKLKTRMTFPYIVIPNFLNSYDINRLCHTVTSSSPFTHNFIVFPSVFQVFSSKTCWLLDFKHDFACWLLIYRFLSRYSARFCTDFTEFDWVNWVPRVRTSSTDSWPSLWLGRRALLV